MWPSKAARGFESLLLRQNETPEASTVSGVFLYPDCIFRIGFIRGENDGSLRKRISKGISFHAWYSLDYDSRTWILYAVPNRRGMADRNERCSLHSLCCGPSGPASLQKIDFRPPPRAVFYCPFLDFASQAENSRMISCHLSRSSGVFYVRDGTAQAAAQPCVGAAG